ncbi:MAG TPA: glycosyl transferase, partial [Verrucomicrobia bacterium]|nr:glycosyl transferase [Verrucomicrobiota bacterium]
MQGISPRYTVLVVTWNGDDLLKTCLDSLVQALDEPPPCVVVDNGAAESTRAL